MSTTVTGSPPPGPVASRRRAAVGQAAPRTRRRFTLPRASTTPGKLWLVLAGLVIASNAAAGSDAFTGLEAGIIVLALVMAAGCGWGLTRRLAEYR